MDNSNEHDHLDRIKRSIEANTEAIKDISQVLRTSSQTQSTKLDTPSALVRIDIIITVITALITAATTIVIWRNGDIQLQQNLFEKDQRTVELNLYLANFWENNFDKDNRNLLSKLASTNTEQRNIILTFLANLNNKSEFNKSKKTQHIMDFLELNSEANDSEIIAKATPYRIALIRTFNTLETVATVRKLIKTNEASCLIDRGYKSTVQESYEQLKPFMYSIRQTQPNGKKDAWKPLEELLTNEWSITSTPSQIFTNKAQNLTIPTNIVNCNV